LGSFRITSIAGWRKHTREAIFVQPRLTLRVRLEEIFEERIRRPQKIVDYLATGRGGAEDPPPLLDILPLKRSNY
jgi:hypothetical protein